MPANTNQSTQNKTWAMIEFTPNTPEDKFVLAKDRLPFLREVCDLSELPAVEFAHTEVPGTVCLLFSYRTGFFKEMIFSLAELRDSTISFRGSLFLTDFHTDEPISPEIENLTYDALIVPRTSDQAANSILKLLSSAGNEGHHSLSFQTYRRQQDDQTVSVLYAIMNRENTSRKDRQWMLDHLCGHYGILADDIAWHTVPLFTAVTTTPQRSASDWVEHGQ